MQRAEILAAGANGLTLAIVAAVLLVEAVRRLVSPAPVRGAALVVVASMGVAVNLTAVLVLRRANRRRPNRRSLNMEGAVQHVLTDLAARHKRHPLNTLHTFAVDRRERSD